MPANDRPRPTELLAAVAARSEWVSERDRHSEDPAGLYSAYHGLEHSHRVSVEDMSELLEAALLDPRSQDVHEDTALLFLGRALGDVAEEQAEPEEAWESAMDDMTSMVRDYEFRADISGLGLSQDEMWIGPVRFRRRPAADESGEPAGEQDQDRTGFAQVEASVQVRGCHDMALQKGRTVVEVACDLIRSFAPHFKPPPSPMPLSGSLSWWHPVFTVRVGQRHVSRVEATKDAIKLIDLSGAQPKPAEAFLFEGGHHLDLGVDGFGVTIPKDWPPERTPTAIAWDEACRLMDEGMLGPWPQGADRFWTAVHWLARSHESSRTDDALVFAVISMEALVGPRERVDGRYAMVADRIGALLERGSRERALARAGLRGFFDLRHGFLHAGGAAAEWQDALDARDFAHRAILRYAENRFTRTDEQALERWFNIESTAGWVCQPELAPLWRQTLI